MRDNRDILDKLRWLSNDMEYMEVPGEWLLPVTEAHSIIVRERDEIERLRTDSQKDALDYLGQVGQLSDEITRLRAALLLVRDMGPMTIDDQRWRIVKDALEGK